MTEKSVCSLFFPSQLFHLQWRSSFLDSSFDLLQLQQFAIAALRATFSTEYILPFCCKIEDKKSKRKDILLHWGWRKRMSTAANYNAGLFLVGPYFHLGWKWPPFNTWPLCSDCDISSAAALSALQVAYVVDVHMRKGEEVAVIR